MNWMTNSRKLLLTGVALAASFGLAMSAQAQTCTISNWLGAESGVTDANAGTQDTTATDNRRYGGPCGLRVAVDGTVRSVSDDSPSAETSYIARFYTFLDNAGSDPMMIFAADDGTADQIVVWFNHPSAGDLSLQVEGAGGTLERTFSDVGSGWHSVELVWEAGPDTSDNIAFSVDGASDLTGAADTSGVTIENAYLGQLSGGANTGGTIDFDDFDSRRSSRPGRLCRGLTNDARTALDLEDVSNIFDEFASNGNTPANGQPDYNEDGIVDLTDVTTVFNRFATANEDCSVNS